MTSSHCPLVILCKALSRTIPALLTRTSIVPDGGFNLPDARGAGFEIAGVPAVHAGTCSSPERLSGGIIADIGRGYVIPGFEERLGNGGTDAAGPAGDQCNSCHASILSTVHAGSAGGLPWLALKRSRQFELDQMPDALLFSNADYGSQRRMPLKKRGEPSC